MTGAVTMRRSLRTGLGLKEKDLVVGVEGVRRRSSRSGDLRRDLANGASSKSPAMDTRTLQFTLQAVSLPLCLATANRRHRAKGERKVDEENEEGEGKVGTQATWSAVAARKGTHVRVHSRAARVDPSTKLQPRDVNRTDRKSVV